MEGHAKLAAWKDGIGPVLEYKLGKQVKDRAILKLGENINVCPSREVLANTKHNPAGIKPCQPHH